MSKNEEVQREAWSPEKDIMAVEEQFQFNNPTEEQQKVLGHIERWGRTFAAELASLLPEGTAKQVAINNVMGAILWSKQSLTHRFTEIVVVCNRDTDGDGDGNCHVHPQGCPTPPSE